MFADIRREDDGTGRDMIADADAVIFLHSSNAQFPLCPEWVEDGMHARRGKAVYFIGNEYKQLAEKRQIINRLGIDHVASMMPADIAQDWWGEKAVALTHALNPGVFQPDRPHAARTYDLGYRGFAYPADLGDTERNDIVQHFRNAAGLRTSIELDNYLKPGAWAAFLNDCRAVLGTEAGKPGGKCISSRHFDAIGTATVQVMFDGRYNDILEADKHYIKLERDFSNESEVRRKLADLDYLWAIAEQALSHVSANHTYAHRMRQLQELLA